MDERFHVIHIYYISILYYCSRTYYLFWNQEFTLETTGFWKKWVSFTSRFSPLWEVCYSTAGPTHPTLRSHLFSIAALFPQPVSWKHLSHPDRTTTFPCSSWRRKVWLLFFSIVSFMMLRMDKKAGENVFQRSRWRMASINVIYVAFLLMGCHVFCRVTAPVGREIGDEINQDGNLNKIHNVLIISI